jgi:hypothetical protein
LEEAGFTDFTDRKAWRDSEYTVDHVTFRSFNAYTAGVMGCTSYSFSIEVGVYYRCFDLTLTRPQDYDLTFRSILVKTIRQPFFRTEWGPARDEPTIFHVLPDGSNLAALLADAMTQLDRVGLPFMAHYREPAQAFHSLMTERSTDAAFGTPDMMMPGNPDSPSWRDVSLAVGHLFLEDPRKAMRVAPVLSDPQ